MKNGWPWILIGSGLVFGAFLWWRARREIQYIEAPEQETLPPAPEQEAPERPPVQPEIMGYTPGHERS
jgi:hypothetical protein